MSGKKQQQYPDQDYYAGFNGEILPWSQFTTYNVNQIVDRNNEFWKATVQNTNSEPSTSNSNWELFDFEGLGYYRFISLEDIVNNYIVGYSDDMNSGGEIPRHKVEFFAQRAVQDFSYDTLHLKSFEYQLVGNSVMPMPQDLVSVVSLSWTNEDGLENHLQPRKDSGNPASASQDSNGQFIYDQNGQIIFNNNSVTADRYNTPSNSTDAGFIRPGYYTGPGDYFSFGKRYYLDPERANRNGTYIVDERLGHIIFDETLAGEIIVLKYVSDGRSSDLSQIRIHKFAETSIYLSIYADLIEQRRDVHANEKFRARKRASAELRNTKHRLSPLSHRELLQVIRGQQQWIKN